MMQRKAMIVKGVTLCLLLALCISVLSGNDVEAASAPSKPSFTVTKRTKTTATIKIKKKDKVTGYQVYVKKGKKGKYRLWTFSFTRTFKIKKLKAGSEYYVKIRAYRTRRLSIKKGKFSGAKKIKKYKKAVPTPQPTVKPSAEPSVDPSADPSSGPSEQENYAEEVLSLVNAERAKEGLSPLVLDQKLCGAATVRAGEIVEEFSHTRPDGTSCFTALKQADVTYRAAGENIAAGQATPASVMNSWMNSSGHRANIMSSNFGKLGVGFVKVSQGYQYYWVQMFTD